MGKGVFKQGHSQEHGTGLLRSARNDDMRNEPPGAALLTLVSSGEETVLHAPPGKDLLSLLRENGFYLPALCDGRGVCGKCKIRLLSGALEPSAADAAHFSAEELADGFRLACTACPEEDLRILAEERGEERFSAVNDFSSGENVLNNVRTECVPIRKIAASFARQATGAGGIPLHILRQCSALAGAPANSAFVYRDREAVVRVSIARKQLYAIGMDIGTTTLGLALVELESGRVVGTFSAVNRQRAFGADVISRIRRANDGDLSALSQSVRTQLSGAVAELCRAHGIDAADVVRIAVAANTSMLHLFLHLRCDTLGQAPFTPVTLDFVSFPFGAVFEGDLTCTVDVLPGISTYVGADITAGILFSGIYKRPKPSLLLDIGTNGEMALAAEGRILCAATAAGPAFEGGNISWGTGSVPGAISSVRCADGRFAVSTIGGLDPVGICGSGVVDTVYEALRSGMIRPDGRFEKSVPGGGLVLAQTRDGQDIVFCQKDVRELQLGKSAIRSGVDSLLNCAGLAYADIETLYVAGGFGTKLNFTSGAGIGLIPEALAPKVSLIGNSSLGGVVRHLLDYDNVREFAKIVEMSEEHSLSADMFFNKAFLENINFG